jgi:hypothetical protein
MKERALRIGKPTPLVGVATEPAEFDAERPAVLILNSGVMHHVGACRLSVKIARAVAERGLLAVRFDYSGIGDSEPRRGSRSFEEVSISECVEVMDYVEKTRGTRRFILYGLCSGADAAYHAALADDRVIGFAQIDAYCYRNWRFYVEHYRPLLLSPSRLKMSLTYRWRSFRGQGEQALGGLSDDEAPYFEIATYSRAFPPREEVAAGLSRLIARGVRNYVVFTGSEPHYNYEGQYRDSFRPLRFGELLREEYFSKANHIITQREYQGKIVERIADWIADASACRR